MPENSPSVDASPAAESSARDCDVSVVIVTRNTCALTVAAIQSILDSRDPFKKEIIVVDNGSTDETPATVRGKFPSVHYIYSHLNLGFAGANNLGARHAHGKYIVLLNSDARLQPDSLQITANWMSLHEECGVAGAQLLNPDGSRQNSIANFPSLATELLNKSLLRRLFPRRFPGKEQAFDSPREVETVIGAFMFIRQELWRSLGGFDERYFFFFEETDFCREVRRKGFKIVHLPQVKVWHAQGKSAAQTPVAVRVEYWRSRYQYFAKHHSALAGIILRTGLGIRLLANCASSGLMKLLTRSERWRRAWEVNRALLDWHLKFCPPEPGLPR